VKFKKHDHPTLLPSGSWFWNRRFKKLNNELNLVDRILGLGLFGDPYHATKQLREAGFVYYCRNSFVDETMLSYTFGKISKIAPFRNIVWGKDELKDIVYYEEYVKDFERYTGNPLYIISQQDPVEGTILVNTTLVNEIARRRLLKVKELKAKGGSNYFPDVMLMRELEDISSEKEFEGRLTESTILHELNHAEVSDEVMSEVGANLTEIAYGTTFEVLGNLYKALEGDRRQDRIFKKCAETIFGEFKKRGLDKDYFVTAGKEEIIKKAKEIYNHIF